MDKFEPQKFINALEKSTNISQIKCPICGGEQFTTTENMAVIMVNNQYKKINIGPNVPAGMLICQRCGHIDFFALGVLGLLPKEEVDKDGDK